MTPGSSPHSPHDELRDCRNAIEVVDRRLVELLSQRVELGLRAADAKRAAGLPLVDPAREAEVLRTVVTAANEHGLPADPVERIFEQIIELSRRAQEAAR